MITKALILAAGLGTRLGDLTKDTPKCLIDVGGKPVIDHVLWQLHIAGITEVVVSVHHHWQKVVEYLGDRVVYSYEPVLLNTAGTIKNMSPWFDEEILVVNADTISNVDYQSFLEKTTQVPQDAYILTGPMTNKCAGTYLINKDIAESFEIGKTIDECLIDKEISFIVQRDLIYYDCGTPEGLLKARNYAQKISKMS